MIKKKIEFNDTNIDELLDIQHNQLSSRVQRLSEIASCKGSSYFPLPKELRNPVKGLIDIENQNNEYFRCSSIRCLNPVNKSTAEIRNLDKEFAKHLKTQNFLFIKKTMQK